mgnify:CR=1 FL=1
MPIKYPKNGSVPTNQTKENPKIFFDNPNELSAQQVQFQELSKVQLSKEKASTMEISIE